MYFDCQFCFILLINIFINNLRIYTNKTMMLNNKNDNLNYCDTSTYLVH